MNKIKVYIIEDQGNIILSGFHQWFRPGRDSIECIGSSVNMKKAIQDDAILAADVIILDLWIPFEKPLENVRKIKLKCPGKPILIWTSEDSEVWFLKMVDAGINGYLTKDATRAAMKSAIIKLAEGETWLTPKLLNSSPNTKTQPVHETTIPLTKIQKIMVTHVANGLNHKEIAIMLKTTTDRIEKMLAVLRSQFQANTTTQLIKILMDLGQL